MLFKGMMMIDDDMGLYVHAFVYVCLEYVYIVHTAAAENVNGSDDTGLDENNDNEWNKKSMKAKL